MNTLTATDVRADFGRFIDSVVRVKPQMIKRSRDYMLAINPAHQRLLLAAYQFHAHFLTEEDGSITATIDEVDIVANAETKENVITELAYHLIEYAEEYYEEFELFAAAPNRQAHFPFVMNILLQDNIDGVKRLIHA